MESWNEKLATAAWKGDIVALKLCLQNGADIDYGDVNGWTALMWAVNGGHLKICGLLVDRGCKIDTTGRDGRTALHLAAREGHLQITRCLVEQGGASPLVTTHKGETPYDLAAKRKVRQYKEVMKYLKTGVTAILEIEDNKVPTEIKLIADKRSVPLYLKLLESGSEIKRDIRLVIVGKKGAGKTSLVKRLFNEGKKGAGLTSFFKRLFGGSSADVTSTNGIEIHMIKCKTKSGDSIWNRLEGNYEETELNARLLKPYEEKIASEDSSAIIEEAAHKKFTGTTSTTGFDETVFQPKILKPPVATEYKTQPPVDIQIIHPVATEHKEKTSEDTKFNYAMGDHDTVKDNTLITILYRRVDESTESKTLSQQPEKIKPPVVTPVEPQASQVANIYHEQQQNLSIEKAHKDIKSMMEKSKVDLHDKEEYAKLLLWDFAGDEELYHTHQTFLSQDAIYLVVTKLNEADDKNAQEMFQLWMNSIHCYCRLDDQQNKPGSFTAKIDESTETQETNILDPPVILVGSHKDKVRLSKGEKIEIECKKQIQSYVKDVSDDACGHIRSEYFISNTKDDDGVFQKIKQDILNLARGMKSWNKEYPLKFIQLEKCLRERKKWLSIPIITLKELEQISLKTPMPMNAEELMLFLKFHHEIRALVYFEDLPEFIVLDTQWLSDAFKCIVTAKKFQSDISRHRMKDKLEDLNLRGILHSEVLEDIFNNEKNILSKHDRHKDAILNIMEKFDIIICVTIDGADEKPCYYVPCMVKSKPEYDIYEMFNVTKDTCKKSTWLCFKFRFLPPHLINHLIAALSRKYRVAEVAATKQDKKQIALFNGTAVFELQMITKLRKLLVIKCPNAIQIQVLQFGEQIERGLYKYIADFMTEEIIKIISTRFKMPNVKFEKKWECGQTKPESVTGSNDFCEDQDTKYYCETCKITHEFTGEWSDLQHGTVDFTKEEINYTKMGMIVLNVLADVSYDLLKPDKPNLRPRSDCDITHLYQEHFKLKKHIPTNGWGGNWQTIQGTDIAVGDDIERIRLTRNELQHSTAAEIGDTRFIELCNILSDLLKRFDQLNKPARLYTDQLNKILSKTMSAEEVQSMKMKH